MTKKQTLLLLALTALYLLFELSFNARLLDVVGGAATTSEIDSIERYGRTLTGIAVTLFVFQALVKLFNSRQKDPKSGGSIIVTITGLILFLAYYATPNAWGYPAKAISASMIAGLTLFLTVRIGKQGLNISSRVGPMVLVSIISVGCVYSSIENLVDHLVEKSSASFRHASLNIILIQKALVDKTVKIDGLTDGDALFSQPEGKAFLALFPFMAISVDRLDEKISEAKHQLITQSVESRVGGANGLYNLYRDSLLATKKKWDAYNKASSNLPNVAQIQDREWNNYLAELRKHGWTPSTVPYHYHDRVLNKVRRKVNVPRDWDLADEYTFKSSVAAAANKRMGTAPTSTKVGDVMVPLGLSFPDFFRHPAIQSQIREALSSPKGLMVDVDYSTADDFKKRFYTPYVNDLVGKAEKKYRATVSDFADNGPYSDVGKEMARAAIVPVIALFFSLIGAVSHLCKTAYLSLSFLTNPDKKLPIYRKPQVVVPTAVFIVMFLSFATLENDLTQSRLYQYLEGEVASENTAISNAFSKVCHIVAVGQGASYPLNEYVRTRVLQGISFGYKGNEK